MLLLAGVVVTLLVRHLPGNLTSVFAGKGRVTPTPARVGNDACMVRHPDGRVELTVSLIRVDVVPFTPYAHGFLIKKFCKPMSNSTELGSVYVTPGAGLFRTTFDGRRGFYEKALPPTPKAKPKK